MRRNCDRIFTTRLHDRGLNFGSNEQQFALKIRLVIAKLRFGHKAKSQFGFRYLFKSSGGTWRAGEFLPAGSFRFAHDRWRMAFGTFLANIRWVDYLGLSIPGGMCNEIGWSSRNVG